MYKLLLLLLISHASYSQDVIKDLIFNTEVSYSRETIHSGDYNQDLLEGAKTIQINKGTWKGGDKINALIQKDVNSLKTDEFEKRFMLEFYKAVDLRIKENIEYCQQNIDDRDPKECDYYYKTRSQYEPFRVYMEYEPVALCNNILVSGIGTSFHAKKRR